MTLEGLMADFAGRNGSDAFMRSADGVYSLTFDDRFTVNVEELSGENAIVLNSFICSLQDAEDVPLRDMLVANLQLRQNGGAAVSLDPDRNELLLTLVIDSAKVDVDQFERQLGRFVDHLENVLQRVDSGEKPRQPDLLPRSIADFAGLHLIRV
jgi:hypothetical protein